MSYKRVCRTLYPILYLAGFSSVLYNPVVDGTKRVSAFCTLLIRVVRVQNTALCERAINTRWALSQHSRMLDMYIFLAFLYIYALTCIQNNQIELNNLLYNPAHD